MPVESGMAQPTHRSAKRAIYAAIATNFAIAMTKLIAAASTGSSSMLSEGIHSIVDGGNDALMLVGISASTKPADELHPFGHGQEVYFYTLMVAVLVFGIAGGMSVYEGVRHVLEPRPVDHVRLTYVILGTAAGIASVSWYFGLRAFLREKGDDSIWQAVRRTKDPTTFAVMLEDSADLLGIAIAAMAIVLAEYLHQPILDGVGSILIGLLMCAVGAVMLRESKSLLLGEAAPRETLRRVREIITADPSVVRVVRIMTMQVGPSSVILALDLQFVSGLSSDDVASTVDRLERRLTEAMPEVHHIFIEAEGVTGRVPRPT